MPEGCIPNDRNVPSMHPSVRSACRSRLTNRRHCLKFTRPRARPSETEHAKLQTRRRVAFDLGREDVAARASTSRLVSIPWASRKGERVALLSESCAEWVLTDQGCHVRGRHHGPNLSDADAAAGAIHFERFRRASSVCSVARKIGANGRSHCAIAPEVSHVVLFEENAARPRQYFEPLRSRKQGQRRWISRNLR